MLPSRSFLLLKACLSLFPLLLVLTVSLSSCTMTGAVTSPRYALVYGIASYPGGGRNLQYTVDDANSMNTLLQSRGISSANMTERSDSAVTKAQIKSDILSLANVSSDSTVIFYFSGHGAYVDASWNSASATYYPSYSGGYICPYDCLNSASNVDTTTIQNFISPSELQSWLSQMGTKNVIVLLDNCYSGAFITSSSATDASPSNDASDSEYSAFATAMGNFASLLVANAAASGAKTPIVLSACGSTEESYDGTTLMQHGVFTYFLLQTASSGDSNGDGYVTTTEAYGYTASAINSWIASTGKAAGYSFFLPHISGGTRDLVLFSK